jgi:crotonobetainyl-CoA:carnitine CoA-transferase CaiB-like acyl-CoA transferase
MSSEPGAAIDLLAGVRVLDRSTTIRGAYCAKLLADHGADTIKIEPPQGDPLRQAGPFPGGRPDPEASGLFLYLNTNKRGVTLDPTRDADRARKRRLLEWADVLVVDQPIDQLDLPPPERLVVTSVTPFGSSGPYAGWAGSDLVCMAMSGVVRSTPGNVDDLERQPPVRPGGRQGDYAAGLVGAFATTLALLDREQTGRGQPVDISEWETLASFMFFETASYAYDPTGTYLRRAADRRVTGGYPRTSIGIWPCADGYVCIAVREQNHFERLVQAMGNPPWADDERFRSRAVRGKAVDILNPLILEWTRQHTVAEICRLAQGLDIPITACNDARQLVRAEQLDDRGFFVDVEHPLSGRVRMPRGPILFSATPWRLRRPAPRLGEHNAELLPDLAPPEFRSAPSPSLPHRSSSDATALPLSGIRVIEFAAAAAAPFCTYWLATMGAEVIKIESYEHPDVARRLEPYADGVEGHNRGGMFNTKGMNKRSCTLNLAQPRAWDLALRLVAQSDVAIENFSYRVARRYDLTYQRLRQARPDIIMVSCSAVGRSGPMRSQPGYNENISAFSGLASLTGYQDGPPGLPGSTWGDYLSGATLALATSLAIRHRLRTGQGQYVDLSMTEALAVQIPEAILAYTMNGEVLGRQENDDPLAAPHGFFPCRGFDEWVAIGVFDDRQWDGLKQALDSPTWADDPRYATLAGRQANQAQLTEHLSAWTQSKEPEQVVTRLQQHGVPAGRMMDAPTRIADQHLQARGFYQNVDHPETGPRLAAGLPFKLGRHPAPEYRHAPLLGQDNEYVFCHLLGLSDEELAKQMDEGVIY